MSERRERALALLRARGLDPLAVADGALATTLHEALGQADAEGLLTAVAEVGDERIAAALACLDAETTDRAARKLVRRALHRLRERGVATPAPTPPRPALRVPEVACEAWLSAVDGIGTRLVWIARPLPSGSLLFVAAELNEPAGLGALRVSEVARKHVRELRARLRGAGIPLVPVPFVVADALVVEGQQRLAEVDRPSDYLRVRPRLTPLPPGSAAEPESPRLTPPAGDEADALVAASATLVSEPEFTRWWPAPDAAEPFVRELDDADASPLVLSPAQQEGRLAGVLARAVEILYPRTVVARRLRGTAYVLAETGRPAAARTVLAVATLLERGATGARDVPLLTALTHQGLGRLAAARAARRERAREDSLIVAPGDALTDRSPGRRPRTRS